ncbi:MAG: DedA family protein [Rhodospirillaceae bacterium]|nr:DedA family protein [Rhodospirillaceae bacterium]
MIRRLYDWTMRLAARRHALWALAGVSFAESSFFPIPPDMLLIPIVLAQRAHAMRAAAVCTASSVLGGFAGYAIGYFLYEVLGRAIVEAYGYQQGFEEFQHLFREWAGWIIMVKGLTPIPYKIVTITSGVAGLDLFTFGIASLVSRGARFYAEAMLLWYFGPPIRGFVERSLGLVVGVSLGAIVAGFLLIRLL